MADHSRRTFLRSASLGAAAAGVAAVGATAAVPAGSAAAAEPASSGPAHAGPFVAWVKDVRSGDVVVLVDDREIVHHDPSLARRLAAIAATARTA